MVMSEKTEISTRAWHRHAIGLARTRNHKPSARGTQEKSMPVACPLPTTPNALRCLFCAPTQILSFFRAAVQVGRKDG